MPIENLYDDVLLIRLPQHPQGTDELDVVNKMFGDTVDRDVIVDLSNVQLLTSGTICGLIILDRLLKGGGRQLVLFNVPQPIKKVFIRTGLLTVFEFASDEVAALEQVRSRNAAWTGE
jgi:anti-anti-sigma regulatory factor